MTYFVKVLFLICYLGKSLNQRTAEKVICKMCKGGAFNLILIRTNGRLTWKIGDYSAKP